jgi:3-dehydroquinate dehydratase / shikimate dehydrogenase
MIQMEMRQGVPSWGLSAPIWTGLACLPAQELPHADHPYHPHMSVSQHTQVVIPIHAKNAASLRDLARRAHLEHADMVEVRLDRCTAAGAKLADVIDSIVRLPLPAIVTNRHPLEGGSWTGSEQERLDWLLRADAAGAAMIDVELAYCADLPEVEHHGALILSHHNFDGMSDDLEGIAAAMFDRGADIAKLVVTPQDAADLGKLERLSACCEPYQLLAIGMGPYGLPSRLLASAWNAPFTFARFDDDAGTAPGQPTVRELLKLYRIKQHGTETRIFGVLGNPVGHSLSPLIHNTALASCNIDAVYVPFQAHDAVAFWQSCKSWIDGLSITIPHKTALLNEVDELEPLAEAIGAINTIYRREDGRTVGANTDADAALGCIRSQTGNLSGCPILILGAGGVARAIAFALHRERARVTIANRTRSRADTLAAEIGCQACALDEAEDVVYRVLVNCTSVGMNTDDSPWPPAWHRPESVVFDTVYTPLETRLLRDAQTQGCQPICGLAMFSLQAIGQFERWCGIEAPTHHMHRVALEALGVDPDSSTADRLRTRNYSSSDRNG